MKLLIEWDKGSLILEPEYSYVLGRDNSSDIHIDSPRISRSHLRLSFKGKEWIVEDLESSNGTFIGKNQIKTLKINRDITLNLGGSENYKIHFSILDNFKSEETADFQDTKQYSVNYKAGSKLKDSKTRIRLQKRIKIGRDSNNDWTIDDPNVSRNHAEILQNTGGQFEIIDLKSMNGTFLNGLSIKRESLKTGDVIRIGSVEKRFTLDGLESIEGVIGTDILVDNVSYEIKGKKLLDNVSFKLGARTLTAIIGPSGAGKSTLLGVLNGRIKPAQGHVLIGGADFHENFQSVSQRIGSVPQSDILHTNLTVIDALKFGARLRLPDDTSEKERLARVDSVIQKLELTGRANLRIDKLSGGQRKRASIGLELLTSPDILVLDEPTSGLDPGLDAHVMETLRNLADDGQTVVVVTHSVDNLELCDNVVLMASGGHIAYCGPASSVFTQLGKRSWAEVFRFLASEEAINFASPKYSNSISTGSAPSQMRAKNKSMIRQTLTMSARYLKVIASDRFYLTLLALIPLIIGVIAYLAGSKYGFGPGFKTELGVRVNPYARGSILVLILGSIFVGLSTSIQEVVKEKEIRLREQSVGIKPLSYLLSKIFVLGGIVIVQIFFFVQIVLFKRALPSRGLLFDNSRVEIVFLCSVLAITSMFLGLMISAFITSTEQAMPALVGMTMVQVVMSGALPLSTGGLIERLSLFSPSYWATNALASSVDLVQLSRITESSQQTKWEFSSNNLKTSLYLLLIFMILFKVLALASIRKTK